MHNNRAVTFDSEAWPEGGQEAWLHVMHPMEDATASQETITDLHQWAVDVSYLLSIEKPEGWREALESLEEIENKHSLIDSDGEATY